MGYRNGTAALWADANIWLFCPENCATVFTGIVHVLRTLGEDIVGVLISFIRRVLLVFV